MYEAEIKAQALRPLEPDLARTSEGSGDVVSFGTNVRLSKLSSQAGHESEEDFLMRFSFFLRRCDAAKTSWEKSLNHPFVLGIVRGDLPLVQVLRFAGYLLLETLRESSPMGAAQADDFRVTSLLAGKAKLTAEAELTVHREHAEALNITDDDLAEFRPAPTAYAYTSHLYRAALLGRLGIRLPPCCRVIGCTERLEAKYRDATPKEPVYQNWIEKYAKPNGSKRRSRNKSTFWTALLKTRVRRNGAA